MKLEEEETKNIFKSSRNNYGPRKTKVKLEKKGYVASLRKIRRVVNINGLVSNSTVKQFKVHKSNVNEDQVENVVNRDFNRDKSLEIVVSDLTCVRVNEKWNIHHKTRFNSNRER